MSLISLEKDILRTLVLVLLFIHLDDDEKRSAANLISLVDLRVANFLREGGKKTKKKTKRLADIYRSC